MDSSPHHSSLHVCRVSVSSSDRVRLTDPYVEEVWSEFLGPTATLLARRLDRAIEERPGGLQIDPSDVAASLGVSPSLVRKAVERLDRFEVVHCDVERGVVGVSGYAPLVGGGRVLRLSESGRVAHERSVAALDEPSVRTTAANQFRPALSIAETSSVTSLSVGY